MADQVEVQLPKTRYQEGSAFTATAYFRTRSTKAASTPTTVHYRVDCVDTQTTLKDWTSVSPAGNVSISVTGDLNAIQSDSNKKERKQIIVQADRGLSTQVTGSAQWFVSNLYGL